MLENLSAGERRRLQQIIESLPGPAPWYWKSFPAVDGFEWTYHGEEGPLSFLVTLNEPGKKNDPVLALNTHCTPFRLPDGKLGVWCPEGRSMIRVVAFDPGQLKSFGMEQIVGWFKDSGDRMYSTVEPIGDFEFSSELPAGTHEISVPPALHSAAELGLTAARKAMSEDEPSCVVLVLYPQAGLLEVLPQRWLTAKEYGPGQPRISRVARDHESHRIVGEAVRIGTFELTDDGKEIRSWINRAPKEFETR
jgi:hypothetical protein